MHIGLYLGRKIAIAHYDRKMSCENHYFVISYFVNAICKVNDDILASCSWD